MDANNEAEFGALRRILQLSADSFGLTLATCNSPRLRESLFSRLHGDGFAFREIALALGCVDPVAEVRNAAKTDLGEAAAPIFVTGLDYLLAESTPGADALLAVFNRSRERWRDAFLKRPLVFWVSEHVATRLMVHAPDFRAWVSHELEFREEQAEASARIDHGTFSRNYLWLSNLDAAGKRARLAELERRLSIEAPDPALLQAWARGWDEKITLLIALGELDEAGNVAQALLSHYPPDNETTLIWRAETLSSLADILTHRGQYDEALRIRREEVLPGYERLDAIRDVAVTKGKIADILTQRGQYDEALRIRREEELPVYERLGAIREIAVTKGQIADILTQRGQYDEALRIRREEELPVYERLGAIREIAVTKGCIADILTRRGQYDEALRIRREEELPGYERLGAIRDIAVTKGKIADILTRRGQYDEALRIRREEELPVYERLGAIREIAVSKGYIADILTQRGQYDEALRIRREEELPVYERLGDIREIAVSKGKIADILTRRGQYDEALRIRREEVLPVYERLGAIREIAVTKGQIANILTRRGQYDEALRICREEVLPVYERLGDIREIAVCRANIAVVLLGRGKLEEDGQEFARNLIQAWLAAKKLGLPEAEQIEQFADDAGWSRAQFTEAARQFAEHAAQGAKQPREEREGAE